MNFKKDFRKFVKCIIAYFVIMLLAFLCFDPSAEEAFYVTGRTDVIAFYIMFGWLIIMLFSVSRYGKKAMDITSGLIQYVPFLLMFAALLMGLLMIILMFVFKNLYCTEFFLPILLVILLVPSIKYELNNYQPELCVNKVKLYIYYFINYVFILLIVSFSLSVLSMYTEIIQYGMKGILLFGATGVCLPVAFWGTALFVVRKMYLKYFDFSIETIEK